MKKIFIASLLLLSFFNSFSQSKNDTKLFITELLKEWPSDKYISYTFSFYDNYFIIKGYRYHIDNNSNRVNNYFASVIDIRYLKSIKYGTNFLKVPCLNLKCSNNCPYSANFSYSDEVIIKEVENKIRAGDYDNVPKYINDNECNIYCENDNFNFSKLYKAFSHLVELYGGKLIDNLFD
jgi:hypothetical protein